MTPPAAAPDVAVLFQAVFGAAPQAVACAPGRVEFIGNHTDYNGGAVLGAAIDRHVWVAAAANRSGRMRLHSAAAARPVDLAADPGAPLAGPDAWANYPLAVWRSLAEFGLPRPEGFDLTVVSDLPAGAGLSSSAALELAVALALLRVAGAEPPAPERLAALARHAENVHVGMPCGILDQGTCACGRAGQLVHIDCRGPHFTRVPLPASARLWIFNPRERHSLVDGRYAERRRECEEAARRLGVAALADLTPEAFARRAAGLPAVPARRARHVVEEHARVGAVVAALRRGDLVATGRLLTASHRSSQRLFENSTPLLDALVDRLESRSGVLGARLTGGGFGGAVLALADERFTAAAARALAAEFADRPGGVPEFMPLRAADGAGVVDGAGGGREERR
ncbi:MAG: galactokinase [Opitutaceae bacterium]|nr:galactokinase [Opitutaceae bacterium]